MNKISYLYIAVGVIGCVSIVAFSLSLYFGLQEENNQNPSTTSTTTMYPETTQTTGPEKNDGTQQTPLDDFVFSEESRSQFYWTRAEEFDFNRTDMVTNIPFNAYVLNMTSGQWLTGNDIHFTANTRETSDSIIDIIRCQPHLTNRLGQG